MPLIVPVTHDLDIDYKRKMP